jgi:prefoldin subunit 5
MIDPLRIPSSVVDALSTLADTAKSLPDLASHLDTRAGRLEEDIAAMRQATERLTEINGVVASIDTRLEKVEARVEAIEGSVNPLDAGLDAVREGLSAVDGRMREMSKLQLQTNEGIDTLVKASVPSREPRQGVGARGKNQRSYGDGARVGGERQLGAIRPAGIARAARGSGRTAQPAP